MNNSYIANEIKSRITMWDILGRYGYVADKKGFICCPFHREKTASMKIYNGDRGYYCFGCGESGDVIKFVQKYFSLSFADAVSKINTDFSLGLPIGEKIDRRKQVEMAKKHFVTKQKFKEKEQEKDRLFCEIIDLNEKCAKLNDFIKTFVVLPFNYNSAQIKAQAIAKLEYTKYIIEQKEMELKDLEKRDSFDT